MRKTHNNCHMNRTNAMKRKQLIYLGLTLVATSFFSSLAFAQSIFDYHGITYKVLKDADESSTFGTVAVTAKDDGFYEGTITIPNAVKQSDDEFADTYKVVAIDDFAFKGNTTLTKVVLPMTIESIGNGAFEECGQLTQIDIPEGSLSRLGESVFAYTGLKSIKLPEGITELPRFTFRECRDLEQVILPNTLIKIGISAFIYCQSLKSIELPKRLREIDICAFSYCGLTSITLPDRVVSIPMSAFQGCFDLEEAILSPYTTTIKTGAFAQCGKLSKVNKPETLNNVEDGAFGGSLNVPEYFLSEADAKSLYELGDKYKETMKEVLEQMKKSTWK